MTSAYNCLCFRSFVCTVNSMWLEGVFRQYLFRAKHDLRVEMFVCLNVGCYTSDEVAVSLGGLFVVPSKSSK